MGLDFAIHLLLHIEERRADGQTTADALKGALHEVGPAMALAAPTTALAFLSFVPTKFDGIAQLGIIAGVGVLIAFPGFGDFSARGPGNVPNPQTAPRQRASARGVRRDFQDLQPIAVLTILLGVFALLLMPQVRFDADQMSLRNPDAPSVQGFNLLFDDPNTVPYRLTRLVATEEEAIETAASADAFETVGSIRSLPDFIPSDQDEKLELIDFGAGTLVFALSAEPGSVDGPAAAEGVATLSLGLTPPMATDRVHALPVF